MEEDYDDEPTGPELKRLVRLLETLTPMAIDVLDRMDMHMLRLERDGMVDAKPHYRNGKYLILVHRMVAGERKREYIGADADAQHAAIVRCERYKSFMRTQKTFMAYYRDVNDAIRMLVTACSLMQNIPKDWRK